MYMSLIVAVTLSLAANGALAETAIKKSTAVETPDLQWNVQNAETIQALRLKGDVKAGEEDYRAYCESCHLPTGGGTPDGSIPQLAGQHATVIIKQLADIRSGLRDNPAMYPFATRLPDAQSLADVAAYIGTLCIPRDSAKYEAPDAPKLVAYGKVLYDKECAQCHQPNGDGVKEKSYPVIAGQHYPYLLRQMIAIRDGKRGNTHPDMRRAIARYDNAQLAAIAAYQAMLSTQVRKWTTEPRYCKPS